MHCTYLCENAISTLYLLMWLNQKPVAWTLPSYVKWAISQYTVPTCMNGSQHTVSDDPMMCTSHKPLHCTCGNVSRHELTYNFSGNTQPQSSQLAEPLWTDPGLKSGIRVHERISSEKKKWKKAQAISPQILTSEEKATTTITYLIVWMGHKPVYYTWLCE